MLPTCTPDVRHHSFHDQSKIRFTDFQETKTKSHAPPGFVLDERQSFNERADIRLSGFLILDFPPKGLETPKLLDLHRLAVNNLSNGRELLQ